jgi:hypothetical protein
MAAEASILDSRRWGNAVRALTRPRLTSRLWLITSLVWFGAAAEARTSIAETATFAATAAILWWFADLGNRREVR